MALKKKKTTGKKTSSRPSGNGLVGKLAKMEKNWSDGKDQSKVIFDKIPEGEYIADLVSCEFAESKSSGNLMIRRCHVISEGEYKGKNIYDNMMVETDLGMAYIAKWLDTVGVDVSEISAKDLPDLIAQISKEGYKCKIIVKHAKGSDFINVRVSEVGEPEDEEATQESESGSDKEGYIIDDGDGGSIDFGEYSRKDLEEFIKENDLDIAITKKMNDDKVRAAIIDALEGGEGEDDLITKARTFCEACDIDLEDDMDADAIAEKIKEEAQFEEDQLDDEDKEILKALEIYDDVVIKLKAKKKTLKRKK